VTGRSLVARPAWAKRLGSVTSNNAPLRPRARTGRRPAETRAANRAAHKMARAPETPVDPGTIRVEELLGHQTRLMIVRTQADVSAGEPDRDHRRGSALMPWPERMCVEHDR
jgi:hypothetical protein